MTRARDISNVITNADLAGDIDVDGTANLDIVNIDGAIRQDGGAVFNETGASVDFRVESDGDINALVVDGSANRVGIGEATPASKLEITAGGNSHGLLRLNESDASNLAGYMQFDSNGTNKANVQNANNAGIHLCVGTGGSVVFTQLGHTAANALEDYEEGTHTFSEISGQASVTTNRGNYTKIGRLVMLHASVTIGSNTNSNTLNLSLPFASSINGFFLGGGNVSFTTLSTSDYVVKNLRTNIENQAADVRFIYNANSEVTCANASGKRIDFFCTYHVE